MKRNFDRARFKNVLKQAKLGVMPNLDAQIELFGKMVERAGIDNFYYDETIIFDLWRGVNDEQIRIQSIKIFLDRFHTYFTGISLKSYNEYPSLTNLLLLENADMPCINATDLAESIAQTLTIVSKRLLDSSKFYLDEADKHISIKGYKTLYSKSLAIGAIACRQRKAEKQAYPQLQFIKALHNILTDIKGIESGIIIADQAKSNIAEQDRKY